MRKDIRFTRRFIVAVPCLQKRFHWSVSNHCDGVIIIPQCEEKMSSICWIRSPSEWITEEGWRGMEGMSWRILETFIGSSLSVHEYIVTFKLSSVAIAATLWLLTIVMFLSNSQSPKWDRRLQWNRLPQDPFNLLKTSTCAFKDIFLNVSIHESFSFGHHIEFGNIVIVGEFRLHLHSKCENTINVSNQFLPSDEAEGSP